MADATQRNEGNGGNDQKLGGMKMKAKIGLVRLMVALAVLVAALVAGSATATAYETGQSFDSDQFEVEAFKAGSSDTRAGARTDFRNLIDMKVKETESESGFKDTVPYGRVKRFDVQLPPGLVGDPTAVPTCSVERFLRVLDSCPMETAVGMSEFEAFGIGSDLKGPVYNLTPGEDQPALFGIKPSPVLYAYIQIEVSPDGEITAVSDENPMAGPVYFADVTMFGVPADHTFAGPRVPFMTNPTNCTNPFAVNLDAFSYEGNYSGASMSGPARIGCGEIPFEPSMSVTPTSHEAGAPTGLDVELSVPQGEDPDELATAHVKDVTMTLPEGMRISASSAAGLGSCSPEQFGYHLETPITCPLSSKIGEVEVETHILDEPLKGPVYVAKQNDNPFNSLLALYMAPAGSGVELKLAGKVDLDPVTGRITTTFLNNPQQPFTELRVSLKDGPRAPLMLPDSCGTYETEADLTSWARPAEEVPLSNSFAVNQGCGKAGQFTPGFSAGTTNPKAGAFSPFTLRVTRPEAAQQNLSRIEATLPQGLLAKLAGVPLCGDAESVTGLCPPASQVGTTTVGAGAGDQPVFVPQPGRPPTAAYLAGPYKGAPYSLVVKVPAQAGPFDLGTVTVRNALHVDPTTVQVTAKSDPLPQILQGVPVSYRDVRVDIDRPNFIVNPTSCEPMAITSTLVSAAGTVAAPSDRFQASGCRQLNFGPQLKLWLSGQMKRSGNPALKAVLTQPSGQANIDAVSVKLPTSQFIDNAHINNPCTRAQYAAQACPPGSILGTVTAYSPLLDQPLTGNVYFRANGGERELPDIVAALRGQISVDLVGFIDSVKVKGTESSRVRNRFTLVPDAPVSKFEMNLKGGKVGLLENSENLCSRKQRVAIAMDGQNGRVHDTNPVITTSCGPKGTAKRR